MRIAPEALTGVEDSPANSLCDRCIDPMIFDHIVGCCRLAAIDEIFRFGSFPGGSRAINKLQGA